MPGNLITAVAPESPAARAGLLPGDEVLTVNGAELRDVIEYHLATDLPEIEFEIQRGGVERQYRVTRKSEEPVGLELSSPVFDRVRTCDNHCPFCFIYQLPKGMRRSLYVKDDDYRLSFLYGNFTTLTRFTEADFERVLTEKLSPLFVSIHATDADLRTKLLRNRRGATSLRWLRALLDADVDIHGQIVVCPGVNDRDALEETLADILVEYPGLKTVAVVPLGVSSHSNEPDMKFHSADDARDVLDIVAQWQETFNTVLGRPVVFAADEYYLLADKTFPQVEYYERANEQHENGIGMASQFVSEVRAALRGNSMQKKGTKAGFFASVDGAPPYGYRADRTLPHKKGSGETIAVLTGEYGAKVLGEVLSEVSASSRASITLVPVANKFFGGNIAVTGLVVGADVATALKSVSQDARVLIPDVMLSADRFLDGLTLADLGREVEVVETNGRAFVEAVMP